MAGEKKIAGQTFEGGRNTDISPQLLPNNQFRKVSNLRIYDLGNKGIASSFMGNSLISNNLPAGTNQCIGFTKDEENNNLYFFNWNSNSYHGIYRYNTSTGAIVPVIQNLTDTGNIDVLKFDRNYPIFHSDIIQGLHYFCDGLNKVRKYNIAKAMDKSNSGYGLIILDDYVTLYKKTSVYSPVVSYITDQSRAFNNVYGSQFKFCVRFHYDDFEVSNWSDWSVVSQPPVQPFAGLSSITTDNNCIQVKVETGNKLVQKIEIAVLSSNPSSYGNDSSGGSIDVFDWVICQVLDKNELSITDNSTYVWNFYNDGSYSSTDQAKINRNYSYMARIPVALALVGNNLTISGGYEGFPKVNVSAVVAVSMNDLFIPDSTTTKINSPSLTVTTLSVDTERTTFISVHVNHYNPNVRFVVGHDVKAGNKFEIFGKNGQSDNYYNSFTASPADTAATIAAAMKTWLRGIGRGAVDTEAVDGDGNASFVYHYLGEYRESVTNFTGNVNPVAYQTLKDNGSSLPIIPYGSVTNYGFVYVDDDGRESNAYTSPNCVVRTPYITEIGDYKLPVHSITISHRPPLFAKYWKLVRTKQPHGLEILIQQVINVPTTNTTQYLDLVVGSLLAYQKLHPNTILKYDFEKGDRLRLIKKTSDGSFYPYYETEVLSYSNDVEIPVNSNIVVDGTAAVKPANPVDATYVNRIISINGTERTIVSVDGTANKYNLDEPMLAASVKVSDNGEISYPSYTIIDRRGTLRIVKPDSIVIADDSLVEVYTPQLKEVSDDYKLFYDISQKYEVINYGTDDALHAANKQNQSDYQPAIVQLSTGDAYIRKRELPTNTQVPGTQVVISNVVDSNASDFYKSDLHDTGRVYPQDTGLGVRQLGSRTRYSANFIQDTSINGLNDFDNLNRVDNNDAYGDILLTKFFNNRLFVYKVLKCAFIPVNHTLTSDADGNVLNVQSSKLLNQIQYFAWEGGIGNNPESWFYYGNAQYFASTNSACFCRLGGDGVEPISSLYNFDKRGREILSAVSKYNLRLPGQFDVKNNEAIWSLPSYLEYLSNGAFSFTDWQTSYPSLATTTNYEVTQQPKTGVVNYNSTSKNFQITGTSPGDDFFLYRPVFVDGTRGAIKKMCFTTTIAPSYPVQINYTLIEQTGSLPYVDGNLRIIADGVQVLNVKIDAMSTVNVQAGQQVKFEAYDEVAPQGTNPTFTFIIKRNGTEIFNKMQAAAAGLIIDYTESPSVGDSYDVYLLAKSDEGGSTPPPPPPATSSALNKQVSTDSGTICSAPPTTVYVDSRYTDIYPGVPVYSDAGLSQPLSGYNYIQDGGGVIYNLDSGTGVVGQSTGQAC